MRTHSHTRGQSQAGKAKCRLCAWKTGQYGTSRMAVFATQFRGLCRICVALLMKSRVSEMMGDPRNTVIIPC